MSQKDTSSQKQGLFRRAFHYLQDRAAPEIPPEDLKLNTTLRERIVNTPEYYDQMKHESQNRQEEARQLKQLQHQVQDKFKAGAITGYQEAKEAGKEALDVAKEKTEDILKGAQEKLGSKPLDSDSLKDQAVRTYEVTKEMVTPYINEAIESVKEKAPPAIEGAKAKMGQLKEQAEPYIEKARESAVVSKVKESAAPVIDQAKGYAQPAIDKAKEMAASEQAENLKEQGKEAYEKAKVYIQSATGQIEKESKSLKEPYSQQDFDNEIDDLIKHHDDEDEALKNISPKAIEQLKQMSQRSRSGEEQVLDKEAQSKDYFQAEEMQLARDYLRRMKEKGKEAVGQGKDKVKEMSSEVKGKGKEYKDEAKEKAQEVKDKAKDKANEVKEKANEKGGQIKEKVKEAKNQASEKIDDAKDKVKKKAGEWKDKAKGTAQEAKGKVQEYEQKEKEKVDEMASKSKEGAKGVVDKAKELAPEAANKASQLKESAKEKVHELKAAAKEKSQKDNEIRQESADFKKSSDKSTEDDKETKQLLEQHIEELITRLPQESQEKYKRAFFIAQIIQEHDKDLEDSMTKSTRDIVQEAVKQEEKADLQRYSYLNPYSTSSKALADDFKK
ncbi:hypothetical protein FGO68_gene15725 [Halteria grandinella]|uniref:Uncharacterized protein n=1 Tax=Halteria grandinella TaxID=5974 RepID=A0A8J8T9C4_HALGN|nr:hypothetical protein FGO68_gene15725 [Halteria grandinella]